MLSNSRQDFLESLHANAVEDQLVTGPSQSCHPSDPGAGGDRGKEASRADLVTETEPKAERQRAYA
jgi:hypothetical protein